jgi:hypothetical protein
VHRLKQEGILLPALQHQIAHVLGFGTLWGAAHLGLIADERGYDPQFRGARAAKVYSGLTGREQMGVPIENTGAWATGMHTGVSWYSARSCSPGTWACTPAPSAILH